MQTVQRLMNKNKKMRAGTGLFSLIRAAGLTFLFSLPAVSSAGGVSYFVAPYEPWPFSEQAENQSYTALKAELKTRGFQAAALQLSEDGTVLRVVLAHPRISDPERVAGRAARIMDGFAPDDITAFEVCYQGDGLVCDFCLNIPRATLNRYLDRMLSHWQLSERFDKTTCEEATQQNFSTAGSDEDDDNDYEGLDREYVDNDLWAGLTLWQSNWTSLTFVPVNIEPMLNNSGGDPYLGLVSDLNLTILTPWQMEAVADMRGRWYKPGSPEVADSSFHPVRSLIEEYRAQEYVSVEQLYLGFSSHLPGGGRLYASAGFQEEMFGGFASQWYYPNLFGNISPELRLDWVKQRDPEQQTGMLDYSVWSSVLGLQWYNRDITFINDVSLYVGRFLARDNGVRLEFGHRFNSGAEISLWGASTYSEYAERQTDRGWGHSLGLAFSLPLNALREKDTRRSIAAGYTADDVNTGQLLNRPVDLSNNEYRSYENPRWYKNFGR